MTPTQQLVYDAVQAGAETARDVEGYTGMDVKSASSMLSNLCKRSGVLEACGTKVYPGCGNPSTCYRVKETG